MIVNSDIIRSPFWHVTLAAKLGGPPWKSHGLPRVPMREVKLSHTTDAPATAAHRQSEDGLGQ
eukprot:638728-Pelagomonas_calceolata.AAC.1